MIKIKSVWFEKEMIFVTLNNQAVIGTPISFYPHLSKGSPEQRQKYRLGHNARSLHWEELDEDLSPEGFLNDVRANPS